MTKLKQQNVSQPLKNGFKSNKNMSITIDNVIKTSITPIDESIYRGTLLMYAQNIDAVKQHLKSLKSVNSKYIKLILNIIKTSITEIPALDIEVNLDLLLGQLNEASFNNHEILDFTEEVLNDADILTSKYFLAVISGGLLHDLSLKKHFKAAKSFVKILLSSLEDNFDLTKQKQFINTLGIIINNKVDYKKIELLPKIKYTVDSASKRNYEIDITRLLHNSVSSDVINDNLSNLHKEIISREKLNEDLDVVDYLIKN